jgi:putative transcriptional regulator
MMAAEHPVPINAPDSIRMQPATLRARYRLSQAEFARLLGISVRTLQQSEQGTRKPTGPALTLLRVVADHPEVFDLDCARRVNAR